MTGKSLQLHLYEVPQKETGFELATIFSFVCFVFTGWSFFIPFITIDTFVPMTWEITAAPHSLYIPSLWYLTFFYRNWTVCNVEVIWKLVDIRQVKNLPPCVSDKNAYRVWERKSEGKRQSGRPKQIWDDNIKTDLKGKNRRLWTAWLDLMIGTSVRLS